MCSVERLVGSWSRIGWLLLALLGACNSAHIETSTETGNPPVIDMNKISLVVSADGVRIVGEAGAITPGGADVELAVVGSSEAASGPSKPDGSFDIPLDASQSAVIEVRAKDGDKSSPTVYVTRGGATVGGDQLSCMQRSNLASQAIGNVLVAADTSCNSAADCRLASNKTVCTDSCGDAVVASSAVAGIEKAVLAIDQGLCASFDADGCDVIAQPCVPPPQGQLACVAGRCTQQEAPTRECPSCLNQELVWGRTNNQQSFKISGCDDFSRTGLGQPECTAKVPHCGSGKSPTLEDVIAALAHADVQQALMNGETVGGPPAPGGQSTRIALAERSFVISNCGSGSGCQQIPQGVLALRQLLETLGNDIECEQPSCPPNAAYYEDVCLKCGPAGGCSETAARCAIVCSDSSPCSTGTTCSGRGICEVSGCI